MKGIVPTSTSIKKEVKNKDVLWKNAKDNGCLTRNKQYDSGFLLGLRRKMTQSYITKRLFLVQATVKQMSLTSRTPVINGPIKNSGFAGDPCAPCPDWPPRPDWAPGTPPDGTDSGASSEDKEVV
ncbi:hypothetical protein PHYPO_G00102360 [Pangasianodon hypophthalmus]|uniref:Uncharacterized protein n=1 Tax=Pangasianodon hypophthalmus TaxID=310915 RepID=A0A5N5PWG1_PANHP|nr:hypothetical protein PHYPO_G00102360 [Pangasianodon hypophthalmus]